MNIDYSDYAPVIGFVVLIISIFFFIFIKISPKHTTQNKVKIYNVCLLLVGVLVCGIYIYEIVISKTMAKDWKPLIMVLTPGVILPGVMIIGGLIRNYLVFPKRINEQKQ